jgi:hypothetical protein
MLRVTAVRDPNHSVLGIHRKGFVACTGQFPFGEIPNINCTGGLVFRASAHRGASRAKPSSTPMKSVPVLRSEPVCRRS